MVLTSRQLNRATLARQMLLERDSIDVVEGVRRAVALQAQEPASPYLALWNRIADFDPGDLDRAFAMRQIVKATLVRITLHAVVAEDYTTFHETMVRNLRASRLYDRRYTSTGLTAEHADAVLPALIEFASEPRTKAEIENMLATLFEEQPDSRLWWALRTFAPLVHAPIGGPWSFGRPQMFAAAPTKPHRDDPESSLQRLIKRYLEGFGPASVEDFSLFALQQKAITRPAFEALADELARFDGPNGATLYDLPGARIPDENTSAPPRMLGMWDSILFAYVDRSRIIPEKYRRVVIRRNGDTLPTLLVDGYVAGVWRPIDGGIEASAFHPLSAEAWEGLAQEAKGLAAMLRDRDPNVYSKYGRWWGQLPDTEVRVLPG
jgi:hypothetical protein